MATKECVRIPTLMESLRKIDGIPGDIRTIIQMGNTNKTQLAKTLGVSRWEIMRWEKGTHQPKVPVVALTIISWAERLRESMPS